MNDNLRAAIIAVIQSFLPVGQLLGLFQLTADDIAIVMLFVSNAITLFFLIFKNGQTGAVAVVAAAGLLAGLALMGGSTRVASAAVDCTQVASLRIEIIDTDAAEPGTRINHLGAVVSISPDPYDGTGNPNLRIIRDNGSFDDSALTGRIEIEENVCASATNLPRDDYEVTLSFDASVFRCDIASPTLRANTARGDDTLTYRVDDCAAAPTPTATATNTPAPTSTPTPAATAVPPTPQVIVVERVVEVTPAPPAAPLQPSPVIRPPATGDAGIR